MPDHAPKTPLRWTTALLLSAAANYGPFLAMAIYALAFVSSSHARRSIWQLLPGGPAFLVTDAMYRMLNIPGQNDWLVLAHSCALTLLTVFALAWLIQKVRWLGYLALAGCALWCSFSAMVLMAMLMM